MAEEENKVPEATPPKLSPITPAAKPVVPGAPRPITVRLRRPVIHKPDTAPDAGATPGAAAPKPVEVKPPAAPAAAAPAHVAVKPVAATPAPEAVNPHATSRIPLPEGVAPEAAQPATIRIKPITPAAAKPITPAKPFTPATGAAAPEPINIAKPITPLRPQSPPTPGAHPLPAGPKPPSAAQVQAAKSKTSRISLDSAIGVAPVGDSAVPKTIKLKRPVDLGAPKPTIQSPKSSTTPIRQTSKIPESAAPAESATVTQKKTLKIKRPGLAHPAPGLAPTGETSPGGGAAEEEPAFQNLTPIGNLDMGEKKESSVFTGIAVAVAALAAVVVILLTLCLGAHAMGPAAGPNSLASIPGPELPWAGRITD